MPETGHLEQCRYFFCFVLLLAGSCSLFGQTYPNKETHSLLLNGISLIINQDYNQAENEFLRLIKKDPEFPLWNIYYAAAKIAKAYDHGYDNSDNTIEYNLEEGLRKSEILLEKDKENIWYNYFSALAKGYLAYYNGSNNNWFSAAKNGLSSVNGFEKCILKDSSFFDAYFGLGVYKYWKSKKASFLTWLPFIKDEKGEGVKILLKAIKYKSYNSYLALYNLIWIYIDQERYTEAANLANEALKQYPDVRLFKWGLARACEGYDIRKAISLYNEILNSLTKVGIKNHYKEVILKYTIAKNYKKLGDKNTALKMCEEILQINITDNNTRKRLEERIKKVKELKKELSY